MTSRLALGGFREYDCRIDLLHGLLEPPVAHGHPEGDHLRGERLTERRLGSSSGTWKGRTEGLNAERAPDVGKRKGDRRVSGLCNDHTDPNDGKWRGGLDEDRGDTSIYPSHLWAKRVLYECSHPKETEADHGGDDDVQPHTQRDPRHY